MLKRLEQGESCTITYVTLDKKRGTGGDIATLKDCRKHQAGIFDTDPAREPKHISGEDIADITQRNPNHGLHGTINFKLPDGSIRKMHTRLIVKYNNHEILL